MDRLFTTSSLNSFHLIVCIVAVLFVIPLIIIASIKKLKNEKFWIAVLALIAFTAYSIIDYDFATAQFKHDPANFPCKYPQDQTSRPQDIQNK